MELSEDVCYLNFEYSCLKFGVDLIRVKHGLSFTFDREFKFIDCVCIEGINKLR